MGHDCRSTFNQLGMWYVLGHGGGCDGKGGRSNGDTDKGEGEKGGVVLEHQAYLSNT